MQDLKNRALMEIRKAETKANAGKPVIDPNTLEQYKEEPAPKNKKVMVYSPRGLPGYQAILVCAKWRLGNEAVSRKSKWDCSLAGVGSDRSRVARRRPRAKWKSSTSQELTKKVTRIGSTRLRWLAVIVLVLSSALNYLDRMVLAALMPTIQTEFGLSREDVGTIFSVFSIVYAFSSPLMGHMLDRVGLRPGTAIIVGLWSAVGMATGFAGSFIALLVCRALLGFAESGGVPATGKGFAMYLQPGRSRVRRRTQSGWTDRSGAWALRC